MLVCTIFTKESNTFVNQLTNNCVAPLNALATMFFRNTHFTNSCLSNNPVFDLFRFTSLALAPNIECRLVGDGLPITRRSKRSNSLCMSPVSMASRNCSSFNKNTPCAFGTWSIFSTNKWAVLIVTVLPKAFRMPANSDGSISPEWSESAK